MSDTNTIGTTDPSTEENILKELGRSKLKPHEQYRLNMLIQDGRYEEFRDLCAKHRGPPRFLNGLLAFKVAMSELAPSGRREDEKADEQRFTELVNSGEGVDFDRDFTWAYQHLGSRSVRLHDAPSVPAWELLEYARLNRKAFFTSFLAWSEKRRKDQLGDDAFTDDRRQKFKLLDRLDEALHRDAVTRFTELVQSQPAIVIETLTKLGWNVKMPAQSVATAPEILLGVPSVDHPSGEVASVGERDAGEVTTEFLI